MADLRGANLQKTNLQRINLEGANLQGADLEGFNFRGANLQKANLQGANFQKANLQGANLRGANLQGANLQGANLQGADLQRANLRGANLQGANFQGANLQGADLQNANIQNANIQDVVLRETNLREFNFQKADLQRADLQYADLREANLRETDLQEADITGSSLYLTFRDNWEIKNIKCDYVYWDAEKEERTPKDRNFRPGEFEELYKWRPLNEFENLIQRSIEFSEEYFEAGKSILNFFGTILRKKYNDTNASVQIKQEGLKVTMIIKPANGDRKTIEKYLDDYGLVITGNMTPEEYTDDRLLLIELKSELRSAQTKLEVQRDLLEFKEKEDTKRINSLEDEVKWLREHVGCILQHSEKITEQLRKMPNVINRIENKPTIGGDRAAIINGNVNGSAITGNENKVAGNGSQIGDNADIHANDVS